MGTWVRPWDRTIVYYPCKTGTWYVNGCRERLVGTDRGGHHRYPPLTELHTWRRYSIVRSPVGRFLSAMNMCYFNPMWDDRRQLEPNWAWTQAEKWHIVAESHQRCMRHFGGMDRYSRAMLDTPVQFIEWFVLKELPTVIQDRHFQPQHLDFTESGTRIQDIDRWLPTEHLTLMFQRYLNEAPHTSTNSVPWRLSLPKNRSVFTRAAWEPFAKLYAVDFAIWQQVRETYADALPLDKY